ncbi:MAG: single-stranded DNA-binding protein [Actinobacteria bacterium]|nr:single-stranded DNA-binding protein [Actinomycetota bacterium]
MYVNNVAVVGNLTSDPRQGEGDGKVVNFRMGVNRRRKPGDGQTEEIIERTEFIDVECWGPQADNITASLHRGDRTIVVGQLKYDQWNDADGNPRSRVRIKASAVGPSLEFQSVPEAATV